jgi:hypothetical protein
VPNEKIPKVAQMFGTVNVFDPHSSILGPTVQRPSTRPNAQLLSYWFSQRSASSLPRLACEYDQ